MIVIPLYCLYLLCIDKLLLKKANWYILHTITNGFVVTLSLPTVINVLCDPLYIDYDHHAYALDITMALHIYHMLAFKKLMVVDWVHHIVMCTILSFTYYYTTTVTITNYLLFFLSGLPGGIDYLMLSLVKYEKMDSMMEKYINSKLNIWIRSPGIIIGAYILFLQYINGIIIASIPTFTMTILGLIWNAQYFTERVLSNYVYKVNLEIKKIE